MEVIAAIKANHCPVFVVGVGGHLSAGLLKFDIYRFALFAFGDHYFLFPSRDLLI
jgi:hypothetical protein